VHGPQRAHQLSIQHDQGDQRKSPSPRARRARTFPPQGDQRTDGAEYEVAGRLVDQEILWTLTEGGPFGEWQGDSEAGGHHDSTLEEAR